MASILEGDGDDPPQIKIPGESIFSLPQFEPFCTSPWHIIRHFCGDFWGLKWHKISKFSERIPGNFWNFVPLAPVFSGDPPRTPLGSLQRSQTPELVGRGSLHPPQGPYPRSGLSDLGLRPLGRSFARPCEGQIFPPPNKNGLTPLPTRR